LNVRPMKEHVRMTWRIESTPAGEVLPSQLSLDFRDGGGFRFHQHSKCFHGPLIASAELMRSVWVAPFSRPAHLHRVRRHPPTCTPRQLDAQGRTNRMQTTLYGLLCHIDVLGSRV
jgi:hypothetical protein